MTTTILAVALAAAIAHLPLVFVGMGIGAMATGRKAPGKGLPYIGAARTRVTDLRTGREYPDGMRARQHQGREDKGARLDMERAARRHEDYRVASAEAAVRRAFS